MSRRYEGEWVVSSLLLDRAERFGDEVAVASDHGSLSYAGIVDRASRVAGFLRGIGVEPGDRVATMLPSGTEYLAVWHGAIWCGAIDVPVNVELRGRFLEHLLHDSGARVLAIHGRWLPRLEGLDLGDVRHVIVVGDPEADVGGSLTTTALADVLSHDPAERYAAPVTHPTYIVYTSGTTGASKGAIHNNRSSFHYLMPFVEGLDLGDSDVCHSMFPLFHQMGRSACTTAALFAGNRVELRSGFSASGFWDDVRSSGATWMGYFGAVILFLWNQEPSRDDRDHALRIAFGSNAPPELIVPWEERFGANLIEVYGSTEIGLGSGLGSGPRKLGTMGLPCRHVELAIVDENDDPVPLGQVGEAIWRPRFPDAIFQGYWRRPEETVEAWRNLWFHSGDAGLLDGDGYFTFRDRIKDVIRRRGENISSFMVEESVRAVDGVLEVAAYAVSPVAATEEEVMIAVIPRAEPLDPELVFRVLCETMPRSAVPRYLRYVDELPKTATQRIQKFRLREDGITPDTIDREALGIFPARD